MKKISSKASAVITTIATAAGTFATTGTAFAAELNVQNGVVNAGHQPNQTPNGPQAANGSITVQGAKPGQSIKNKKFQLYKVFDVENAKANESVNYTFVEKYKPAVQNVVAAAINKRDNKNLKPADVTEYMAIDYIQSLNTNYVEGAKVQQNREGNYSAFRYFSEDLKNEIRKLNLQGDTITVGSPNQNNEFTVSGLSWGYYFVDEVSTGDDVTNGQPGKTADGRATDGKHFASSLVLVNTANEHFTIKLKSDYPEIVKKIREDDNRDKIGSKKDGWNDVADYEIGQTVPYQYDVNIPNMNGYHEYYMAMEDKMDKELTFHANKDEIKMVITKGNKSYTLKANEYKLSARGANVTKEMSETHDQLPQGSTFMLEIEDIKKIIDREFAKELNVNPKTQEADYSGMNLHVEYAATVNEFAADKTGRPGFENDVRLIFSNDPDSTGTGKDKPNPGDKPKGKTPWDTVVAFTYRFNGIKTDNYDKPLADARFKLYSDAEMKNEVFVKVKGGTTRANSEAVTDETSAENAAETTPTAEATANTEKENNVTDVTANADEASEKPATTETVAETTPAKTTETKDAETNAENTSPNADQPIDTGTTETPRNPVKEGKEPNTTNLTTNAQGKAKPSGKNEYVVVNRDKLGGTDHTGGNAPADAAPYIQSDAEGNFSIVGLDAGVYYLKEIKAPQGYRLLKDPIKITVTATMTENRDSYIKGEGATEKTLKALAATGDIKEFYHEIFKTGHVDFNTDVAKGSFDGKIINERLAKLPITGEQGLMAAAAISTTLVLAGAVIYAKHRKQEHENNTTL